MKKGMNEEDRKPNMERAGPARVVQSHPTQGEEPPNQNQLEMAVLTQAAALVLSHLVNLAYH